MVLLQVSAARLLLSSHRLLSTRAAHGALLLCEVLKAPRLCEGHSLEVWTGGGRAAGLKQ